MEPLLWWLQVKKGGGKAKGAKFEREVCKQLSRWVSAGAHEDLFWRSAMSGGRATVAHAKGNKLNRQAGDICSVSPEGHVLTDKFYIELKFYKSLDLGSLLFGKGKLADFWKETVTQARKYGKSPFLVAQENRRAALVLVPNEGATLRHFIGSNDLTALARVFWRRQCSIFLLEDVLATSFQVPKS